MRPWHAPTVCFLPSASRRTRQGLPIKMLHVERKSIKRQPPLAAAGSAGLVEGILRSWDGVVWGVVGRRKSERRCLPLISTADIRCLAAEAHRECATVVRDL